MEFITGYSFCTVTVSEDTHAHKLIHTYSHLVFAELPLFLARSFDILMIITCTQKVTYTYFFFRFNLEIVIQKAWMLPYVYIHYCRVQFFNLANFCVNVTNSQQLLQPVQPEFMA